MSTPATVYVLRYSRTHGDEITVCGTEQTARDVAAEIAREYWRDAADSAPGDMPATPEGLTDEEAVRLYFRAMEGQESYGITAAPVIAGQAGACTAMAEYVLTLGGDEDTAERVCGGHLADKLRELLHYFPGEWTVAELNPGAGFACEHGEDGCE